MTKKEYEELKEIEDKLYDICRENKDLMYGECGDIWSKLYTLLSNQPDQLKN